MTHELDKNVTRQASHCEQEERVFGSLTFICALEAPESTPRVL